MPERDLPRTRPSRHGPCHNERDSGPMRHAAYEQRAWHSRTRRGRAPPSHQVSCQDLAHRRTPLAPPPVHPNAPWHLPAGLCVVRVSPGTRSAPTALNLRRRHKVTAPATDERPSRKAEQAGGQSSLVHACECTLLPWRCASRGSRAMQREEWEASWRVLGRRLASSTTTDDR